MSKEEILLKIINFQIDIDNYNDNELKNIKISINKYISDNCYHNIVRDYIDNSDTKYYCSYCLQTYNTSYETGIFKYRKRFHSTSPN
jgi:hypothetical protein